MRFVTVRDLRIRPGEVFRKLAAARELVLTSHGKPIAVFGACTEEDLEEVLSSFRSARALAALRSVQARSAERGTSRLSDADIDAEIRAVRKLRRSRPRRRAAKAS